MATTQDRNTQIPVPLKFVFGGSSGMFAATIVHPMELTKTRMQISGMSGKKEFTSSWHCVRTVVQNEGILALYKGLGAALLRQATYTTTRLGIYTYLNDLYRTKISNHDPTVLASLIMATIAGACGAFVGTPAEIALIRMSADGKLPLEERRNYKNVMNALVRITRGEGVLNLWRGCLPTIGRAVIVNISQLASYSQFKSNIKRGFGMKDGFALHLLTSTMSGLLTSITSMPLDIAKTRIQNQKVVQGKPEFTGTTDVLIKLAKNEGIFALWKGFTPYFLRLGPHTVLTFLFLEQMSKNYKKFVMGVESKDSRI